MTLAIILAGSILVPLPIYLVPQWRWLTVHNTLWIGLTFCTMLVPVVIAMYSLVRHERHLGLRHPLSSTQRLFTSNWFAGDGDTFPRRGRQGLADPQITEEEDNNHSTDLGNGSQIEPTQVNISDFLSSTHSNRHRSTQQNTRNKAFHKNWIPSSFIRFLWFCLALSLTLLCLILGEAYAEIYLRTLPHNNIETVVYVYSWVCTVLILDGVTQWILISSDSPDMRESRSRVHSYPLAWIFKLYYQLTYQTYVRALYARLRSPSQFLILQLISSTSQIVLVPLTMSQAYSTVLSFFIEQDDIATTRHLVARSFFIRGIAENMSMITFLGEMVIFHYFPNGAMYPYLSFRSAEAPTANSASAIASMVVPQPYNFSLTLRFSLLTSLCEICAGFLIRRLVGYVYKIDVTANAVKELGEWGGELLPTAVVTCIHVGMSMAFCIIRLRFK
jgi:hypothetical protein